MAISMAKQFGIKSVALPTNGNAGAALAAYAARAPMEAVVICPQNANHIARRRLRGRVWVADGQIYECLPAIAKAPRTFAVSIARRSGVLPAVGQKVRVRVGRAVRWKCRTPSSTRPRGTGSAPGGVR